MEGFVFPRCTERVGQVWTGVRGQLSWSMLCSPSEHRDCCFPPTLRQKWAWFWVAYANYWFAGTSALWPISLIWTVVKTQVGGCPARIVAEARYQMLFWYPHFAGDAYTVGCLFSKYLAKWKHCRESRRKWPLPLKASFFLNCAELFSEGLRGSVKLPGHTFIIIHSFNDGPVQKTVHGVLYKSRDICVTFWWISYRMASAFIKLGSEKIFHCFHLIFLLFLR